MTEEQKYLTVEEVAEILRASPQTVRNMIKRGEIPAIRIGRPWLIKKSDLDRILEGRGKDGMDTV